MRWFVPNTKVTILRGSAETEYGDVIDSAVIVQTGIPAVVALSTAQDQSTEIRAEIRDKYAGLVPHDTDIRPGDVLLDEYLGTKYSVADVGDRQPLGPFRTAPLSLTLIREEV